MTVTREAEPEGTLGQEGETPGRNSVSRRQIYQAGPTYPRPSKTHPPTRIKQKAMSAASSTGDPPGFERKILCLLMLCLLGEVPTGLRVYASDAGAASASAGAAEAASAPSKTDLICHFEELKARLPVCCKIQRMIIVWLLQLNVYELM